jgi:signal peptidase I
MTNPSEYGSGNENGLNLPSKERLNKKYRKRQAMGWVITLFAAIIIALALRLFVFEFIRVDGLSMMPVLCDDEYVFMERVSYWLNAPRRGDIIVCSFPDSKDSYIKRVIGLPGESVKVERGVLYIDGMPNNDYFSGVHNEDTKECIVPENCVMVMGDNRNDSADSRKSYIGPIPYDKIQGKADFIIWPFDKAHGL